MTEFRHYTTFDETIDILRDVVERHHLKLIPEQPILATPNLTTFDHVDESVVEQLRRYGVVELEGSFTKHALQFKQRDGGSAAGTYYRDETVGPRIHWTLPGQTSGTPPSLGPGSLSYQKSYRDPSTNERVPASRELVDAFRDVVKTMKKRMVSVKHRGSTMWVGRDTKRRWDAGELKID